METTDERLGTAASLVRQGAVLADIGTDHAYLPLFLLRTGRIARAVAADLREGPLARARENVQRAGLSHRIDLRLSDGLDGMEGLGITDITVCGMGGELIARIIDRAPFVRSGDIRLVLQPMSRAHVLRRYLAANGFAVDEERLCTAAARTYVCIAAHYTGVPYTLTEAQAQCGSLILSAERTALSVRLVRERRRALLRELNGKLQSKRQTDTLDTLRMAIATLDAYLEEEKP